LYEWIDVELYREVYEYGSCGTLGGGGIWYAMFMSMWLGVPRYCELVMGSSTIGDPSEMLLDPDFDPELEPDLVYGTPRKGFGRM
jgi:hypothetical protein